MIFLLQGGGGREEAVVTDDDDDDNSGAVVLVVEVGSVVIVVKWWWLWFGDDGDEKKALLRELGHEPNVCVCVYLKLSVTKAVICGSLSCYSRIFFNTDLLIFWIIRPVLSY